MVVSCPSTPPLIDYPTHRPMTSSVTGDASRRRDGKPSTIFSIDQILGMRTKDEVVVTSEMKTEEVTSNDASPTTEGTTDSDADDMSDTATTEELSLDDGGEKSEAEKQTPSYTAIIAQAILSSSEKKLPLGCIYEYIGEHFPAFLKKGQGWRNCVRHNLSLSECFVKAGRARNGRGNYWGIHPRYAKNFSKGDFRKRRASHRPRNRHDIGGFFAGRFFPAVYPPTPQPPPQYVADRRCFDMDSLLAGRRAYAAATASPLRRELSPPREPPVLVDGYPSQAWMRADAAAAAFQSGRRDYRNTTTATHHDYQVVPSPTGLGSPPGYTSPPPPLVSPSKHAYSEHYDSSRRHMQCTTESQPDPSMRHQTYSPNGCSCSYYCCRPAQAARTSSP